MKNRTSACAIGTGRKTVIAALCFAAIAASRATAFSEEELTNASPAQAAPVAAATVTNENELAYDQIELLTEVMMNIRRHYVEEKRYDEIVNGALHGMLESLDPHSAYMEPDAFKDMQDDTAGFYGGIGIHLGMRNDALTVIAPIEDTPAFKAGIQSGDRILKINGEKTTGMSLRDAVKKLRGEKGTEVTISVIGANDEKPRDVTMVREEIELPSVKGTRMIRNGVGYVRITEFKAPTAGAMLDEIGKLKNEGMTALVLDLRGNPGGLLKTAAEVAELFLERRKLIVTTRGRESGKPGFFGRLGRALLGTSAGDDDGVELKASGDIHMTDFPMAILVNGGSASASEIVAGALQDHKRAVLIGDTTYGKGSVQSVIRLRSANNDAAIRLTTALYYTPSGRVIHDRGIEPDLPVPISGDEWRKVQIRRAQVENPKQFTDEEKKKYADVVDVQLERAVDLLQALKIFK